ncbi:YicC family protein [Christensenellaceae bacterium OttesenSCG-928-L17]|nr:YicC family protein [Christensenellaceae bacterium OttesenSCG-928-L17]
MIRSMTGYGRGYRNVDGREITVELKSVNHRYLDISMRMPRHLLFLEDAFRKQLQTALSRGHVDIYIHYRNTRSDAKTIVPDIALIGQYLHTAEEVSAQYGIRNDMTASAVMRLPDAMNIVEEEEDRDAVLALTQEATALALDALIQMREAEGERLYADFRQRAATVLALAAQIEARAPLVVEEYAKKLTERIAAAVKDVAVDSARLATEIALFSDRASIDEEITRLKSHVTQMLETLDAEEPAGRKLDFVVQEMNREFNTIGSKANDAQLTNAVIAGKGEIEKIREQVQNIE